MHLTAQYGRSSRRSPPFAFTETPIAGLPDAAITVPATGLRPQAHVRRGSRTARVTPQKDGRFKSVGISLCRFVDRPTMPAAASSREGHDDDASTRVVGGRPRRRRRSWPTSACGSVSPIRATRWPPSSGGSAVTSAPGMGSATRASPCGRPFTASRPPWCGSRVRRSLWTPQE
jgi:hypothetical protein